MTEQLTEHFGYQPMAVVDDIINTVNEIMYKCTEELETVLDERKRELDDAYEAKEEAKEEAKREAKRQRRSVETKRNEGGDGNGEDDDVIVEEETEKESPQREDTVKRAGYTKEEIEKGTAQLESLLEHLINKNFDKFEVYTQRNILNVPEELVKGGYLRLKHQEKLDLSEGSTARAAEADRRYEQVVSETASQLRLNRALSEAIVRYKKLGKVAEKVRSKLAALDYDGTVDEQGTRLVKKYDLKPLREVYGFLVSETQRCYKEVEKLEKLEKLATQEGASKGTASKFVDDKVREMLAGGRSRSRSSSLAPEGSTNLQAMHNLETTLR